MPEIVERFVSEIVVHGDPRREIYAKRRFAVARQPDAVRGPAAVAVGRSVLTRLGRGAVPGGRHHAADRAAPQNLPRARRRGARQSVLRSQHAHPRELRRGVLPAGRLGVRHHRLHVLVDGQGRVDLRHQPRDERLRRRARDPPSGARLGGRIRARDQRAGDQRRRRPRRASEPGAARPLHDPARVLAARQDRRRRAYRAGRRPEVRTHRAFAGEAAGAVPRHEIHADLAADRSKCRATSSSRLRATTT